MRRKWQELTKPAAGPAAGAVIFDYCFCSRLSDNRNIGRLTESQVFMYCTRLELDNSNGLAGKRRKRMLEAPNTVRVPVSVWSTESPLAAE